ncbi:ImmA/IrrE family metallo-endopeptidase [Frigoribacterium sp. ME-P-080]|uniref:ImmA/IrrE family metallo-endopeptidase n=1 Tax=Frigoribacterium sp. ME-P-080 TaxID=3040289 RepID=UPI00254B76B9|nr:ImmA/IrrE family metallo-endopeptidase [Frigoribacterium sp. ME-P-080]
MAKSKSLDAAREQARDYLETYWTDDEGMVTFPVDPVAIANRIDVEVVRAGLKDKVSGLLVREDGASETKIFLNKADSPRRQRFTCAHELGHLASRSDKPDEKLGFVDSRDELARAGTDPDEIFANAFAAELLMPGAAVRKWWADGMSVLRIARIFDVSTEAMDVRLSSLGLN